MRLFLRAALLLLLLVGGALAVRDPSRWRFRASRKQPTGLLISFVPGIPETAKEEVRGFVEKRVTRPKPVGKAGGFEVDGVEMGAGEGVPTLDTLGGEVLAEFPAFVAAVQPDNHFQADVRHLQQSGDSNFNADATQTGLVGGLWGLDRIDQTSSRLNAAYRYTNTGAGVEVYVLDSGILTTHTDFGGRARFGFSAFGDDGSDLYGHGTHVAGTIGSTTYGVAKGVELIAVKVLDSTGGGTTSTIIRGLEYVQTACSASSGKKCVVNLSLSGNADDAVDAAVNSLEQEGILVVSSAGNDGLNTACKNSPQRASGSFVVGATTSSDKYLWYSNFGNCVDILAPGGDVLSTYTTSTSASTGLSGTSMAAPHVSGAAALILSKGQITSPAAVKAELLALATPLKTGSKSPSNLLFKSDY